MNADTDKMRLHWHHQPKSLTHSSLTAPKAERGNCLQCKYFSVSLHATIQINNDNILVTIYC